MPNLYTVNIAQFYQFWAAKFFFCECLNMANVIGQIYFIDVFLGGEFLQYGTDVLKFHLFKDPQGMYVPLIFLLSEAFTHSHY